MGCAALFAYTVFYMPVLHYWHCAYFVQVPNGILESASTGENTISSEAGSIDSDAGPGPEADKRPLLVVVPASGAEQPPLAVGADTQMQFAAAVVDPPGTPQPASVIAGGADLPLDDAPTQVAQRPQSAEHPVADQALASASPASVGADTVTTEAVLTGAQGVGESNTGTDGATRIAGVKRRRNSISAVKADTASPASGKQASVLV